VAVSFVDYFDGLRRMEEQILPLLVQAGVRAPLPGSRVQAPAAAGA
jgi:hypothetical protein